MPLININVVAGRSDDEIERLLDAAHRAMVATFSVPERDRYQIVHEIPRPRTREQKEAFYERLCEELQQHCGIEPSDVMVAMTQNTDEDWSFGYGRAQFLTGEL